MHLQQKAKAPHQKRRYGSISSSPVTEFLQGSDITIAFDQEDHPPANYRPGHADLLLEGQIGGYTMTKIFMDGGSGVNIYSQTHSEG